MSVSTVSFYRFLLPNFSEIARLFHQPRSSLQIESIPFVWESVKPTSDNGLFLSSSSVIFLVH